MDAQDDVRGLRGEGLIVEAIAAVLFEPVGCLAEFRADEFNIAARELFAAGNDTPASGSQAYWRLVRLLEPRYEDLPAASRTRLEELELAAVRHAELYEDVRASLQQVRQLGVANFLVSSLSHRALARFIERFSLADLFADCVAREDAGGVMARPPRHAIERAALDPRRIICLVDTAEALELTKQQGLNAMLMINDYDEGRALAERGPAGGLVSLAELADALRVIEQRAGLRQPSRPPRAPYELFEPT
jgi:beta-phosphoglucomutase-like phosphatase (HAD superfamily)